MSKLQIVIVSYNVRHFLHQALSAIQAAARDMDTEIWVVDNDSKDASAEMVDELWPDVKLIANQENTGFAVANNQAIRQSSSEYVLLLNPDTVVEEDSLQASVQYMDKHPKCGALGIRMIDGSGAYLPESKRGLPTPWVALCKTLKLHRIFPRWRAVNGYYLGYLDEYSTSEVDVLSGAYMMMRRSVLDEVGLLDEDYFMYGEDVDLSYRIQQAGHQVVYFAGSSIIHYKGESTKKGSLNYLKTFYKAMILFSEKHYSPAQARIYSLLIHAAIVLHAVASFLKRSLLRYLVVITDAAMIYGGMWLMSLLWQKYRYGSTDFFTDSVNTLNLPLYTLVWILSIWLGTGYDKHIRLGRLLRSLGIGGLILMAIYGMLPMLMRNSRMLVVLGFLSTVSLVIVSRLAYTRWRYGRWGLSAKSQSNIAIIGAKQEALRVRALLSDLGKDGGRLITVDAADASGAEADGNLRDLLDLVGQHDVDELIFCAQDLEASTITGWMTRLGPSYSYKIVAPESTSIIGSPSRNSPGELYTLELSLAIDDAAHRRSKWIFDKISSIALLVLFPVGLLYSMVNRRSQRSGGASTGADGSNHSVTYLKHSMQVLLGQRTWVGYHQGTEATAGLPDLKPGIYTPRAMVDDSSVRLYRINLAYARDYEWSKDLGVLLRRL